MVRVRMGIMVSVGTPELLGKLPELLCPCERI